AVLAILTVNNMQPTFRGTAVLLIEQGKSKVVSIEEVYSQGSTQREYYQTQIEILKSEELARKVVQKLNLASHPEFDIRQNPPTLWDRLTNSAPDLSRITDARAMRPAVARF